MTQLLKQADKVFPLENCRKHIIHVEDDPFDQTRFKNIVHAVDPCIVVDSFSNGLELLQYLGNLHEEQLPQLIFLDLRMPIWDGIRTLNALQFDAKYSAVRIYMLSASDTQYEVDLCLRLGARAFITKPASKEEESEFESGLEMILNNVLA